MTSGHASMAGLLRIGRQRGDAELATELIRDEPVDDNGSGEPMVTVPEHCLAEGESWRAESGDELSPDSGKAVFLQAAVGFVRDSPFEDTRGESWQKVGHAHVIVVTQSQARLELAA